jgi:integrase
VTFHLVHRHDLNPAQSPYRIVQQETGREVPWINRFLDRECVRRLAETTLRSYALDLLHFLRWWFVVHHTDDVVETALTESTLADYVRVQSGQQPRPAAASINRRIVVAERALRNEFPDAPYQFAPGFHQIYRQWHPMGIGRPRSALSRLRVRTPKRNIVPLSIDEVARFWASFEPPATLPSSV